MDYQQALVDYQIKQGKRRKRNREIRVIVIRAIVEIIRYQIEKQSTRKRASSLGVDEGERRHQELRRSPPERSYAMFRMKQSVFANLCKVLEEESLLCASDYVSVGQQVHFYIMVMGHKCSVRMIAKQFNHSLETITRYTTQVRSALVSLHGAYVRLPDRNYKPARIYDDPKYMPYFKNCLGALGGTQIAAVVSPKQVSNIAAYRNRKGTISQNVLVVCSFEMEFQYVLAGWEGSAYDGMVLKSAISEYGFEIPDGKFFLGDAGYPLSESVLVPFRGIRCHLDEQYASNKKPETMKELFNLRHSSLINVVERTIGVLKK